MRAWDSQTSNMKKVWIALALLTVFLVVHGTWTYRQNAQRAFAQAVEAKLEIPSIHVHALSGVLVLSGQGTKAQSRYAEELALYYIERYSSQVVNPPSKVRNEIVVGDNTSAVSRTRILNRSFAERLVAGFTNIGHGFIAAFL